MGKYMQLCRKYLPGTTFNISRTRLEVWVISQGDKPIVPPQSLAAADSVDALELSCKGAQGSAND
jgi:hypothetical protein